MEADLARLQRERDLYLRLLELGGETELEPFLREALALVVELTGANQGYLELTDDQQEDPGSHWSMAKGFSETEVERVRTLVSRGIIAEAVATGQTIHTPSALLDPRFRERGSVQISRIEAVLCVPIGSAPPAGVLYLQGRKTPGLFSPEDQASAELFARHVAPIAHRLLSSERQCPDPTKALRHKLRLEGVVGRSASFVSLLGQVALVAPLDVSVLLTGETGTGKSQIARVIHDNGPRSAGPFVEVNCAALPDTLVESELFGAMPGAHSTATRRIEGKVASAEKGTLFLDEVGELSPPAQAKLLQLLQSKQYTPLGQSKALTADLRMIAATNMDLQAAVAERKFREDLFYRLQVLPIRVPSLAERREDVADLATFFLAAACERNGLPLLELSTGAMRALQPAEWPGNVRQLAHAIQAAAIRAAGEGSWLLMTKGYAAVEVEQRFAHAGELCEELGETIPVKVFYGLFGVQATRGDPDALDKLLPGAQRLAERSDDPASRIIGHLILGLNAFWRGRFPEARRNFEQGLSLYRMGNFEPFAIEYGYDVALYLHAFETFALWQTGLADQAEALRRELLSIAEASRNPYSICHALANSMTLGCDRGDTDLVLEQSERLIALANEHHLYLWLALATCCRGGALLQKGQTADALESIQQGLSLLHNFGVLVSYAFFLSYLAAAHLKAGQASDGLAVTDEALSLCQKLIAQFAEPDLLRLKGELLLLQGDRRAAEEHLLKALRLAQDRHALPYELRAATSLGRMMAGMGRREEAVELLGTVYKRFNEGFDTADLRQAATLLRDLGVPSEAMSRSGENPEDQALGEAPGTSVR